MYKGTTPTLIFNFPETFDVTQAEKVLVTISSQGSKRIEKGNEYLTIEAHTVSVYLTQEETLSLPVGKAFAQINMLYDDGSRAATNIVEFLWEKNLHNEVME